ncbi:probable glutamate receptor, partial [Aphidius gifuensis]|uniref:probable glutamate receptor n=1 Tax=Aphidius gifuensis TaxID=684658 RepID=UPI001CDC9D41
MSYPIWVVIFSAYDNDICKKCKEPNLNDFNLKYDTEFVVFCCDYNNTDEWWSQDGRTIKVFPVSHIVDGKMQWVHNNSLFYRRYRVMKRAVRVATVADPVFFNQVDGNFRGFFGEILTELKRSINFTMAELIIMKSYGRLDDKKKWSGLMRKLSKNEADIGVAALTITSRRLDVVDFTLPLITAKSKLYLKLQDGADVNWFGYFQSFDTITWATILGIIITTPILLTLIKFNYGQGTILSLFVDNFLDVWGIFCQQGLYEFPNEASLRVALVSIFLTAIVVSAAYSASLISNLATSSKNLPFNNIEEFADQKTWKLIVLKDSADFDLYAESDDVILKKMFKLMRPLHLLPTSVNQAFEQVCEKKVVFYVSDALKQAQNINMSCDLVSIDTGRIESLAMTLPRGSEFTRLINYHIQRFRDNGMLNRLKQKYFIKSNPPNKDHNEVSFSGITPILIVVIIGVLISLLILIIELSYK